MTEFGTESTPERLEPPTATRGIERLIELDKLRGEAFEAKIRAQGNREAGRTSLIIGSTLALAGGFVAKCVMELDGKTGNWENVRQDAIIAISGLAYATVGMINAKKNIDASPMNFVRAMKQRKTAEQLNAQIEQAELLGTTQFDELNPGA